MPRRIVQAASPLDNDATGLLPKLKEFPEWTNIEQEEFILSLYGLLPTVEALPVVPKLLQTVEKLDLPTLKVITALFMFKAALQIDTPLLNIQKFFKKRSFLLASPIEDRDLQILQPFLSRAMWSASFHKTDDGRKMLGFLFGCVSVEIASWLFDILKEVLSKNRRDFALTENLKFVLLHSWKMSEGAIRLIIEAEIESVIMAAILSQPTMAIKYRQCLSEFHDKRDEAVISFVNRIYPPILWRYIPVANWKVRMNASALFGVAFPFSKEDDDPEDAEAHMDMQYNTLMKTIVDIHPEVRKTGIKAASRILAGFWEVIPCEKLSLILDALINKAAKDGSSPSVRATVIEGIGCILNNPLSHPAFESLLPSVLGMLNDKQELPRKEVAKLLSKLLSIQSNFSKLLHLDVIFPRLVFDTLSSNYARSYSQYSFLDSKNSEAPKNSSAEILSLSMKTLLFQQGDPLTSQFERIMLMAEECPATLICFCQNIGNFLEPIERLRTGGAFLAMGTKSMNEYTSNEITENPRSKRKKISNERSVTKDSAKRVNRIRTLYICAEYLLHFKFEAIVGKPKVATKDKKKNEKQEDLNNLNFLRSSLDIDAMRAVVEKGRPTDIPSDASFLELRFECLKILMVCKGLGLNYYEEITDPLTEIDLHYSTLAKLLIQSFEMENDYVLDPNRHYHIDKELTVLYTLSNHETSDVLTSLEFIEEAFEILLDKLFDKENVEINVEDNLLRCGSHLFCLMKSYQCRQKLHAMVEDCKIINKVVEISKRMFLLLISIAKMISDNQSVIFEKAFNDVWFFKLLPKVVCAILHLLFHAILRKGEFLGEENDVVLHLFHDSIQQLSLTVPYKETSSKIAVFFVDLFRELSSFWALDVSLRKSQALQQFLPVFVESAFTWLVCCDEKQRNSEFLGRLLNIIALSGDFSQYELTKSLEAVFKAMHPSEHESKWAIQFFHQLVLAKESTTAVGEFIKWLRVATDDQIVAWKESLGILDDAKREVEDTDALDAVRRMMEMPTQIN